MPCSAEGLLVRMDDFCDFPDTLAAFHFSDSLQTGPETGLHRVVKVVTFIFIVYIDCIVRNVICAVLMKCRYYVIIVFFFYACK